MSNKQTSLDFMMLTLYRQNNQGDKAKEVKFWAKANLFFGDKILNISLIL